LVELVWMSLPDAKQLDLAAVTSVMLDELELRLAGDFRHDLPVARIAAWTHAVGAETLWLAPRLPPGVDVPESWLGLSRGIVLDTFDPSLFGGTGRTSDWDKFKRHRRGQPGKTWILSGGLNPENIGEAIAATGARFIDVNSGVESAPGVKDHARLRAFVSAVRKAARR